MRVLYLTLLTYYTVSMLSYTPHYLSYFNELIGDRKNAYLYLADSNIDWGENEWYLQEYQKRHPASKVNPAEPTSGRIIVNINDLTGVDEDPKRYQWLRENFKPVDHVAYSYLVYDIPER